MAEIKRDIYEKNDWNKLGDFYPLPPDLLKSPTQIPPPQLAAGTNGRNR